MSPARQGAASLRLAQFLAGRKQPAALTMQQVKGLERSA